MYNGTRMWIILFLLCLCLVKHAPFIITSTPSINKETIHTIG